MARVSIVIGTLSRVLTKGLTVSNPFTTLHKHSSWWYIACFKERATRKICGQHFKALALSLLHCVIHMWLESVFFFWIWNAIFTLTTWHKNNTFIILIRGLCKLYMPYPSDLSAGIIDMPIVCSLLICMFCMLYNHYLTTCMCTDV